MTNYEQQAAAILDAHNRAASYGAHQTNPLTAEHLAARDAIDHSRPPTDLGDPQLARVTRVRLLTDAGFPWYDVSYVYGELRDGTPVTVWLGAGQLRKGHRYGIKGVLVDLARTAGRNAKALGLLDDDVISICR